MGVRQVGTFLANNPFEEAKPMTDSQIPASNKTIMVVDDDPEIVTLVKTLLEREGYVVQTAYNGLEVFSRLEEQKPDLIILDIMMPQMDGMAVLTRLKKTAETSSIPVIMLTAKVQYEDMLGGYKLGANYYITKPFTSTQLIKGINLVFGEDQKHLNQPDQFIKAWLAVNAKWLQQVLNHPVAEEKEIAEVKLIHPRMQLNDALIESYPDSRFGQFS